MRHNFVVARAQSGRFDAAVAEARFFIVRLPDDPRGDVDLGVLLARTGRTVEAREVFLAGLARFPDHDDLLHNLELLAD
jgi:Flp pilus assembly protein TadD